MNNDKPLCTATYRLIKQAIEMSDSAEDLYKRLHFLLCATHVLDDSAKEMHKVLWNDMLLAKACDEAFDLFNHNKSPYDL